MAISTIHRIILYTLVFLMLFGPFAFMPLKMACLAVLIISSVINFILFPSTIKISKSVLIWFILFICHGLFFLLMGLLYNAKLDYVLQFGTIAVIWPFVFLILFFFKVEINLLPKLYNVLIIATLLISIYTIYNVIAVLGLVPNIDIYSRETPLEFDESGNVEMSLPAATTLMFTLPSIVSLYLLTAKKKLLPVIIIGLISVVLISRRALLLNILITPILCLGISFFFLNKDYINNLTKRIVTLYIALFVFAVVIFLVLAQLEIFDVQLFFSMIMEGFDFKGTNSVDPGAQIRAEQFNFLIQSWSEKPALGWGYGSVSQYVIRSDKTPFIYELSYVALLFQTGIFGTIFYLILLGWIYYKLYKLKFNSSLSINKYTISMLVGLTTFLFANATNPYLYAFDHMWVVFYPLFFINTLALGRNESL